MTRYIYVVLVGRGVNRKPEIAFDREGNAEDYVNDLIGEVRRGDVLQENEVGYRKVELQ